MAYIKSENKIFYNLIKEKGFELIVPDYQREFEWDDENFMFLLEEIKETEDSKEAYNYAYNSNGIFSFDENSSDFKKQQLFLGNIVMHESNIVDGQQRLTSIMIIMKALSDLYDELKDKNNKRKQYISEISNRYKQKKGDKFIPLVDSMVISSYKKTSEINKKFINNKLSNNLKIMRLYNKALNFFREISDIENRIDKISFRIFTMQFIVLRIDELEQAFDIFEKLNSKSTPLSPSDLIKNKLISKFHKNENFYNGKNIKKILNEIIDNLTNDRGDTLDLTTFYRTSLMIMNSYNNSLEENSAYIVKNKLYKNQFENEPEHKLKEKIIFVYEISFTYNKYFLKNNVKGIFKNICYRFLDMKKTIVLSTMTLYFCKLKEDKKIIDFDWYKLIKWLENYFLGMFSISNNPSKEVDKLVPVLIHRINNLKNKLNYERILEIIKKPLLNEFPETDRKKVYDNLRSSTFKNVQAIQILNKLYDEVNLSNEQKYVLKPKNIDSVEQTSVNTDYASLEHFLPQNPSKWSKLNEWNDLIEPLANSSYKVSSDDKIYNYIHSIGNMFILHKKNNSGLGNDSFIDKKNKLLTSSEYKNSKEIFNKLLIIEENIEKINSWTKNEINKRAKTICKIFKDLKLLSVYI